MKALLVNGSPHRVGNTYLALRRAADALEEQGIETEFFWIGAKPIGGCMACGGCAATHRCVVEDAVNACAARAAQADGFLFGTPVYYAGPAGNFCSFMDRLFYSCGGDGSTFYLKPAAAVAVARRAGCTAALDRVNKYFGCAQMPIVSSSYWDMAFGRTSGEVEQDGEGMQTMTNLGRNMAWLLKCIQAGRSSGVALPECARGQRTNFIR